MSDKPEPKVSGHSFEGTGQFCQFYEGGDPKNWTSYCMHDRDDHVEPPVADVSAEAKALAARWRSHFAYACVPTCQCGQDKLAVEIQAAMDAHAKPLRERISQLEDSYSPLAEERNEINEKACDAQDEIAALRAENERLTKIAAQLYEALFAIREACCSGLAKLLGDDARCGEAALAAASGNNFHFACPIHHREACAAWDAAHEPSK